MKSKLLLYSFLSFLGVLFSIPAPVHASAAIVSIDPLSLKIGDYLTIEGSGFKSQPGNFDFVCFNDANSCLGKGSAAIQSWSDARIVLKLPGGALSGQVFLVLEEQSQQCSPQAENLMLCGTVSEQRRYYAKSIAIIPTIAGVTKDTATMAALTTASSGDTVHVFGTGFEKNGQVYFDGTPGRIISWESTHIVVQVPEVRAQTKKIIIKKTADVSAEMSFSVLHPLTNDTLSAQQYYLGIIHASEVWQYTQGEGVTVAVIDIGVNLNHEDLGDAIWKNSDEIPNNGIDDDKNGYMDDQYGFNFGKNTAEILATGDHGTMISGIIAAQKDNAKGIAGIAPKARIMPLQIDISAAEVVSQVNKAIRYAADNGADVINMSFVTPGRTYVPFVENDYKDALWYAYVRGVVLVVAAGNGDVLGAGQNLNLNLFPQYPICNGKMNSTDILLGVSALDTFGEALTSFSSYGDTCVNISAPGKDIVSASHPAFNNGKLYATQDGTSFAAPQVAAAAALLRSYKPQLANWEIIQLLIKSADQLPDGSRRMNIKAAFDMLSSLTSWARVPTISSVFYDPEHLVLTLNGLYLKSGYRLNIEQTSNKFSQSIRIGEIQDSTVFSLPLGFRLDGHESYTLTLGDDTVRSNAYQLKPSDSSDILTSAQMPIQQPQTQFQPSIQTSPPQLTMPVSAQKKVQTKSIKRNLTLGMIGADVRDVKNFLKKQKLYAGKINKKFDTTLKRAVQKFQKKYKLSQTGKISGKTRSKINELLKKG